MCIRDRPCHSQDTKTVSAPLFDITANGDAKTVIVGDYAMRSGRGGGFAPRKYLKYGIKICIFWCMCRAGGAVKLPKNTSRFCANFTGTGLE